MNTTQKFTKGLEIMTNAEIETLRTSLEKRLSVEKNPLIKSSLNMRIRIAEDYAKALAGLEQLSKLITAGDPGRRN